MNPPAQPLTPLPEWQWKLAPSEKRELADLLARLPHEDQRAERPTPAVKEIP